MRSATSASLRGSMQVPRAQAGSRSVTSCSTMPAAKNVVACQSKSIAPAAPRPVLSLRCQATTNAAVAAAANSPSSPAAAGINGDVAITGATGTVGARLVRRLVARGVRVRVLTRDSAASANKLAGIPKLTFYAKKDWGKAIDGALGGVVNLAGEPIATRWSPALKAEIRRSRLEATRAVADAIINAKERPPVLVSSSAVGFYGTSETASFSESSGPGEDFLAKLCVEWEAEAARASEGGKTRVVTVRTGIVLAREGGALSKMLPVFSLFAGGPLGSGNQICSWIHIDDLVSLFVEALANPSYEGAYNGTAPSPVPMAELCSELGATLGRPSWLPVPEFALTVSLSLPFFFLFRCRVLLSRLVEKGKKKKRKKNKKRVEKREKEPFFFHLPCRLFSFSFHGKSNLTFVLPLL